MVDEDEKLVSVNLPKGCTLTHDDGKVEVFKPGMHNLPPHVAEHWWIKAHSDNPPKIALKPGTQEYAKAMQLLVESRQKSLQEAQLLLEDAERQLEQSRRQQPEPVEGETVEGETTKIPRRPITKG